MADGQEISDIYYMASLVYVEIVKKSSLVVTEITLEPCFFVFHPKGKDVIKACILDFFSGLGGWSSNCLLKHAIFSKPYEF